MARGLLLQSVYGIFGGQPRKLIAGTPVCDGTGCLLEMSTLAPRTTPISFKDRIRQPSRHRRVATVFHPERRK
jgi:hypothetical protein